MARGRVVKESGAKHGAAIVFVFVLIAACSTITTSSATISQTAEVAPSSPDDTVVRDDEEWIAYQWVDGEGDGIFVVRPDGSGQHQLVADLPGSESHPDWSPDGQHLAFIHTATDGRSELWTVGVDGSGAERLLRCNRPCNQIAYPDWSSDGNAIFFAEDANSSATHPPTTFRVDRFDLATGRTSVVLERHDGISAEQPRISPDDQQVVYARYRDSHDGTVSAIFVSDLQGGPERQLTEWTLRAAYPDWSLHDLIVFNTYDLGFFQDSTAPANLYVMAPDGSGLRQLTDYTDHDIRATQPRWAPDGSGVVYTQVVGEGWGTRTAAFLSIHEGGAFWPSSSIDATHPTLRPVM
jgi:Tol biopolymer transport system component